MSTIDEIKDRIDIIDLVSESVQLRRAGKNYTGFCPFHPNTRTPAFVVFPDTNSWHCFGQCNEGGDVFKFVMKREGWDFPEALERLAERAGVEVRPPSPREQAAAEEHQRLRDILEDAVTFFRHQLLETTAGKQARDYLNKRGLTNDTQEIFGLGYAPKAWDALTQHFTGKGYSEEDLLEAGLVSSRDTGGVYDRFRHRVVFPIRDARGRIAGFGARTLDPADLPKYLNTPQTAVFDKGRLLFGLDRARKAIRAEQQAVIVEGYMDVIALHQAGYANTVSPMGTALTEHQLRLLKRLARRVILALDADAAGDKATLRGLQVARQTLDREQDPVFDARGLVRHEGRLNADIRVTALPEGQDPDEVVGQDPEAWGRILENAKPIVVHVMDSLAADLDLQDPKSIQELASQVIPLIEDVPSPIERDTYLQKLARMLQVDERTLMSTPTAARPRGRRSARSAARAAQTQPRGARAVASGLDPVAALRNQEAYCLGILLRRPELIYRVDRWMQEAGLQRLATQDFQTSDHQLIYRLIHDSLEQEEAEPVHFVLAQLPLSLMDRADQILAITERLDLSDDRVLRELMRGLLEIRRRHLDQNIDQLRYLMQNAQSEGDTRARQYQEMMTRHLTTRALLDRAMAQQRSRAVAGG